ncbi:MAG: U32 family peptidase [Erysipelotrichaceae bacterium]
MNYLITLTNIHHLPQIKQWGIDGIIIGIQDFTTRFNHYFQVEELEEIERQCHQSNLSFFVNINKMMFEDDLKPLNELMLKLSTMNIDGIFFNDLAVLNLALNYQLESKLIFHPDTLLTNYQDIQVYLDFNLQACMLAHEITLEETLDILKHVEGKIAMNIHGRQVMSYSKRRFIDNYLKHIGKQHPIDDALNLSLLESTRDYPMPVIENKDGTSIFTDYTLCSYKEIKAIKQANLKYAIIDDILMDIDEVEAAVKGYMLEDELYIEQLKKNYPDKNYGSGYYYQKTNLVK